MSPVESHRECNKAEVMENQFELRTKENLIRFQNQHSSVFAGFLKHFTRRSSASSAALITARGTEPGKHFIGGKEASGIDTLRSLQNTAWSGNQLSVFKRLVSR